MYGKTELSYLLIPVALICAIAVVTDLRKGKIYNWLTLPAMALGLAGSASLMGWQGLTQGALGLCLGLLLYGWMFFVGAMGAGDVKLLMALGAWGGPKYAVEIALLAILIGGTMGLVVLAAKGRLKSFVRKVYRFLLTLLVRELEVEKPAIDRKLTLPYGVPISVAAIWILIGDPIGKWGLDLW